MRIIEVELSRIKYEDKEISDTLLASIERIGLSFPLKLKEIEDGYECVDGNKRIKALLQLNQTKAPAIIVNNGNNRSNDCWRDRNYH